MSKNKGGRPLKVTEAVVSKLEEAFSLGCTDAEACLHAGISRATLYEHQKRNPKFTDRKAQLKETPILMARMKIISELENDTKISQWYLERKKADEFGQQTKLNIDVTHKMNEQQLLDTFNNLVRELTPPQQVIEDGTNDCISKESQDNNDINTAYTEG